ncbi:hypothetical protein [Roseibacillus ishigakijimensis]|uniref:Uncharacterized protein n=1 Tax=Roseibacillus ishigakijimensis TaxID=454146 RepID=A0A934RMD6_9BACT|nr:hypothetical protein [Roseibacillus ishigakijimensis]MBK1833483.1 hypothetical protein [Roseibacillus ishigakijimensis]
MTLASFLLAKTLATLGLAPMERYRTNAAFETHLLTDARTVVGELVWENLEDIEEISAEYWKLRKIQKSYQELLAEEERLEALLEEAQEARAQALEEVAEMTQEQVEERDEVLARMKTLTGERDEILRDGRAIKRNHAGLKTKLEYLLEASEEAQGPNQAVIDRTHQELQQKRHDFEEVKKKRDQIDEQLEALQSKLSQLTATIEAKNQAIREKAEEQFSSIGKTNKALTTVRSQLSPLDSERLELCAEIGHFVIENAQDPAIRERVREQRGLLKTVLEIRASSIRHKAVIGR